MRSRKSSAKIAIVGTDLAPLDPRVGALEKLCVGWAAQLERMGFRILLFSVESRGDNPIGIPDSQIFRDQSDLDMKLHNSHPDVVIINNRPTWKAACIRSRINLFHNYPDAWLTDLDDHLHDQLMESRNLAVSSALCQEINEAFPSADASVLYPFIDQRLAYAPRMRTLNSIDETQDRIRLLFPNRTMEKKGLRWLIETIDEHLVDQVSLTVIRNISPWTRETDEHRGLLDLARSRPYVTIREKVLDANELAEVYRSHDVVVTPSIQKEGLGLIPLEAQALGVPVVASDLGGLKESVLAPNRTVPMGSHLQLAQAILSATTSMAKDRESISRAIIEKFSLVESGRNLANEIDTLLDSDRLG